MIPYTKQSFRKILLKSHTTTTLFLTTPTIKSCGIAYPKKLCPNIPTVKDIIPSLPIQDGLHFYQSTLRWPTKFAFIQTTKNGSLVTFPSNLIAKIISKYYNCFAHFINGHLVQER